MEIFSDPKVRESCIAWVQVIFPDRKIKTIYDLKDGEVLTSLKSLLSNETNNARSRSRPYVRFNKINDFIRASASYEGFYQLDVNAILNRSDEPELCKALILMLYLGCDEPLYNETIKSAALKLSIEAQGALFHVLQMLGSKTDFNLTSGLNTSLPSRPSSRAGSTSSTNSACATPHTPGANRVKSDTFASPSESPLERLFNSPLTGARRTRIFTELVRHKHTIAVMRDENECVKMELAQGYRDNVAQLEATIQKLESELSQARRMVTDSVPFENHQALEEELQRLRPLAVSNPRLVEEIQQLKQSLTTTEQLETEALLEKKRLEQQKRELGNLLGDSNKQAEMLKENLEYITQEWNSLKDRHDQTKSALKAKTEECQSLFQSLREAQEKPASPQATGGENLGEALLREAEARILELEESLKERDGKVYDVQAELVDYQTRLELAESELRTAEGNNIELTKSLDELGTETQSLKDHANQLLEATVKREGEIAELSENLQNTEASVQTLHQDLRDSYEKYESDRKAWTARVEETEAHAQKEINELTEKLSQSRVRSDQLESNIGRLQIKNDSLSEELHRTSSILATQTEDLLTSSNLNRELESKLTSLTETRSLLEASVVTVNQQLGEMTDHYQRETGKVEELTSKLIHGEAQISLVNTQLSQLESKQQCVCDELRQSKEESSHLSIQLSDEVNKYRNADAEVRSLEEQLRTSQQKNESDQRLWAEKIEEIERMATINADRLDQELVETKSQVEQLAGEVSTLSEANAELVTEISEKASKIAVQSSECETLLISNREAASIHTELNRAKLDLESGVNTLKSELHETTDLLHIRSEKVVELSEKLDHANETVASLKLQYETSQSDKQSLKAQLNTSKTSLADSEVKMTFLRRELQDAIQGHELSKTQFADEMENLRQALKLKVQETEKSIVENNRLELLIGKAEVAASELEAELATTKDMYQTTSDKLSEVSIKLSSFEKELQAVSSEREEAVAHINELTTRFNAVDSELNKEKETCHAERERADYLTSELEKLVESRDVESQKATDLSKSLQTRIRENSQFEDRIRTISIQIEEKESLLRAANQSLDNLTRRISDMEKQQHSSNENWNVEKQLLHNELETVKKDLDEEMAKLNDRNSENDILKANLVEKDCRIESLTQEVTSLSASGDTMYQKFEALSHTYSLVTKELQLLKDTHIATEEDLATVTVTLASKQACLEMSETLCNQQKTELADLHKKIAEEKNKLRTLQQNCDKHIEDNIQLTQASVNITVKLEKVLCENESLTNNLKELETTHTLNVARCNSLKEQLITKDNELIAVTNSKRELMTSMSHLETGKEGLMSQVESLVEQLATQKTESQIVLRDSEQLKEELTNTQNSVRDLTRHCEEMQLSLAEANATLLSRSSELEVLCDKNQQLIVQLAELHCQLAESQTRTEELGLQLSIAEKSNEQILKENTTLAMEIASQSETIKDIERHVERVQQLLQSKSEQLDSKQASLVSVSRELENAKQEVTDLTQNLKHCQNNFSTADLEKKQVINRNTEMEQQIHEFQNSTKELQDRYSKLCSQSAEEISVLAEQKAQLEEHVTVIQSEITSCQSQIEASEREVESKTAEIKSRDANIAENNLRLSELSEEKHQILRKVETLVQAMEKKDLEINASSTESSELTTQLAELQMEAKNLHTEVHVRSLALSSKAAEADMLRADKLNLEVKLHQATTDISQLVQEKEQVSKESFAINARCGTLSSTNSSLTEEIDKQHNLIDTLNSQIEELKRDLEEKSTTYAGALSKNEELAGLIQGLEAELLAIKEQDALEVSGLNQKVVELTFELEKHHTEMESLSQKHVREKQDHQSELLAEKDLLEQKYSDKIQELAMTKLEFTNDISALRSQHCAELQNKDDLLQQLKEQMSLKETELASFRNMQQRETEQLVQQQHETVTKNEEKHQQMSSQLDSHKLEIATLNSQLEEMADAHTREVDALKIKNIEQSTELGRQMNLVKNRNNDLDLKLNRILKENREIKASKNEMQELLERYKVFYRAKKELIKERDAEIAKFKADIKRLTEPAQVTMQGPSDSAENTLQPDALSMTDLGSSTKSTVSHPSRRLSMLGTSERVNVAYGDDEGDVMVDATLQQDNEPSAFGVLGALGGSSLHNISEMDKNSRISEIQKRNSRYPAHMKSVYPAETQTFSPERAAETSLRTSVLTRSLKKQTTQPKRIGGTTSMPESKPFQSVINLQERTKAPEEKLNPPIANLDREANRGRHNNMTPIECNFKREHQAFEIANTPPKSAKKKRLSMSNRFQKMLKK